MHFVRMGEGNPPLVFVHGFACTHADWNAQLEHFSPKHTVLACDLRGHGASEANPADCSIETCGADVAALLADEKLPPAILVGHSMGCRVVMQTWLNAPERVAGLVLIDGSRLGFGDPATAERVMNEQLRATGYGAFARKFFESMFIAGSDPRLKDEIVSGALELPAAIGGAFFPRLVGWDARNTERALASVTVPLMVVQSTTINAERVRVPLAAGGSSPWLDLVKARSPGARIEIVTGAGHFSQIEAAARVNALLEDFAGKL